jgi:hypothetical protein
MKDYKRVTMSKKRKKTKKLSEQQLKERALLLMAYSFLNQVWLNKEKKRKKLGIKDKTEADIMFETVYKKLLRIRMFFIGRNQEIKDFLLKNVPDNISKVCDTSLVGIILLGWFKRLNKTKDIILNENIERLAALGARELVREDIEIIDEDENREIKGEEIIENSIDYTTMLVNCLFPNENGLIEFRKKLNHFPFNLLDEAKGDEVVLSKKA